MVPLVPEKLPNLKDVPVLIAAANQDTIAGPERALQLAALLRDAGADLTVSFENSGHGLTAETVETVKRWITEKAG